MDPLRDEGEAYAAKIVSGGSLCEHHRVAGAPHSFAVLDGILTSGRKYNEAVISRLKKLFAE